MITTRYRIRIDALDEKDRVVCSIEQSVAQDTLQKSRPRLLIRFTEKLIREFLHGHAATEKRLAAGCKRKKPRVRKMGLEGLLEEHNHANHV